MEKSVILENNGTFRISITSNTNDEKQFLEKPISEIEQKVYQYFDQAVKEELGEIASILNVTNDSGFPYEIYARITLG